MGVITNVSAEATKSPKMTVKKAIVPRYIVVALLPNIPVSTVKEVIFVAGPAKRNTSAAPGLTPFIIKAAATGVEAVAHI